MGCGGSRNTRTAVETGPLHETSGVKATTATSELQEDGALRALQATDLLDVMGQHCPGVLRCAMGSTADPCTVFFREKMRAAKADKGIHVEELVGLGLTCRKGKKPSQPNQDSWAMLRLQSRYSIYSVFDGHGAQGHDVSDFVKQCLPKLMLQHPDFLKADKSQMLQQSFLSMHRLIEEQQSQNLLEANVSGSTCSVAIHDVALNTLTLAHVADSSIVLATRDGDTLRARVMTRDHKPDLEDERQRIIAGGGVVWFDGYAQHRIYAVHGGEQQLYPGVNMSRCLGDLLGHKQAGCSSEPEISLIHLRPKDELLLVCSDGVWEFMLPQEVIDFVSEYGPEEAQDAADALATFASERWLKEEAGISVDDITVLLIYLHYANVSERP